MKRFLKINAADNVAVALADDLRAGESFDVDGAQVVLREDIARGHKFALRDIAQGENVIKYGYPIGHATEPVAAGAWIHSHNLKTNLRDDLEYSYAPKVYNVDYPKRDVKVMGYLRKNNTMGIRNELWIVPSVGCVNGQAQAIAARVKAECDCSHLDDVRVYTHNYGCSQL
ncbi:MAG: altronate dehydratase family protein, partial [Alistipes sp.]|nr:altronate dehydratase family protein [Alistipes sp.]